MPERPLDAVRVDQQHLVRERVGDSAHRLLFIVARLDGPDPDRGLAALHLARQRIIRGQGMKVVRTAAQAQKRQWLPAFRAGYEDRLVDRREQRRTPRPGDGLRRLLFLFRLAHPVDETRELAGGLAQAVPDLAAEIDDRLGRRGLPQAVRDGAEQPDMPVEQGHGQVPLGGQQLLIRERCARLLDGNDYRRPRGYTRLQCCRTLRSGEAGGLWRACAQAGDASLLRKLVNDRHQVVVSIGLANGPRLSPDQRLDVLGDALPGREFCGIEQERKDRDLSLDCGANLEPDPIVILLDPLRPVVVLDLVPVFPQHDDERGCPRDLGPYLLQLAARRDAVDVQEDSFCSELCLELRGDRLGSPATFLLVAIIDEDLGCHRLSLSRSRFR